MKISVLLPTQYISNNKSLIDLDEDLLGGVTSVLLNRLLEYGSGVIETEVKGYYRASNNEVYKSKYIKLTVYSDGIELSDLDDLFSDLDIIRGMLKQESIGVIIDNKFYTR